MLRTVSAKAQTGMLAAIIAVINNVAEDLCFMGGTPFMFEDETIRSYG
jgi:hypothetical protein